MKLSDFSLLKEDDKNYTIGHPQGKSMMVPKAGMSAKAQELVSKLKREQHFDEGGEVDLPVDVSPISGADQAPPAPTQDVDLNASPPEQTVDLNAQKAELNPQAPASEAAPAAAGANPLTVGLSDAPINQAVKDINAGTAAEGKAGATEQASQALANKSAASQLQELNTRTQASDKAALGLSNAVSAGKIDPGRLWSHLSTGSKISASLGMILGGIGAGLTHGPNMALDLINKAIENDIDAQKNEQGKNMNLWKMNREALGNDRAATLASISQGYAIAHGQAVAAQAGIQGDLAKARMAPVIQGLQNQAQQVNRQRAILDMTSQPASDGSLHQVDPSSLVSTLVPKEHQQKVFDEIGTAQDTRRMSGSIMDAFEKSAQENTALKTGAGLLRTPAAVLALHQAMQPTFKDLEGTVRQAAMENTFKNITPRPGDLDSTVAEKRKALQAYLQSKASAPTAKGYGIDLGRYQSTNLNSAGFRPGSVVSVKGQQYRVGADGNALEPL